MIDNKKPARERYDHFCGAVSPDGAICNLYMDHISEDHVMSRTERSARWRDPNQLTDERSNPIFDLMESVKKGEQTGFYKIPTTSLIEMPHDIMEDVERASNHLALTIGKPVRMTVEVDESGCTISWAVEHG